MAFLHEICTKDYCPTSVPLNAVTYAIISHQTVCKLILKLQANRNMANIVLELDPNPAKKMQFVQWSIEWSRKTGSPRCFYVSYAFQECTMLTFYFYFVQSQMDLKSVPVRSVWHSTDTWSSTLFSENRQNANDLETFISQTIESCWLGGRILCSNWSILNWLANTWSQHSRKSACAVTVTLGYGA